MKKVLVISYSQAGQTQRALTTFLRGFEKNVQCDRVVIEPKEKFPFPWKMSHFFRVFPRSVRGVAPEIENPQIRWDDYDLVILGFQVWFLSPSLPIQGFLQSPYASGLRRKKVVTLVTCRNLWHSASRTVHDKLTALGAQHLGQITLGETSPLWASFVTTPRWMLTGKKSAFAFFPEAGISAEEFAKLEEKGERLGLSWVSSQGHTLSKNEYGSNLKKVSLSLMDAIGFRFFLFWSAFILLLAPRAGILQDILLLLFRVNLVLLILTVAPCTKLFEVLVGNSPKWQWGHVPPIEA
jgi:hypothetical protein